MAAETVVAPIPKVSKPRLVSPLPAKTAPTPGPSESRITRTTVQKASGNLAIQRALDSGTAESAVTAVQKAPVSPQEDPGYQAVVKRLAVTAKRERTPPKKPDEKAQEVKEAAELPVETLERKSGYERHLQTMETVPPPKLEDFTVAGFTEKFRAKVDEIASKLPKEKKDQGAVANVVSFVTEKVEAVQDVKTQSQNLSAPLRKEAEKKPSDLKGKVAESPELRVDPAGNIPEIANARAAAPKPKTNQEISMDEESRALDDSLKNHNVGGQAVDIEESSLAYPVSGEKDFDEAGEAKRKAQEEIRKVVPGYRAEEKAVIAKSEAEIPHIVTGGLKKQHQTRSDTFDNVLGVQKDRESNIESAKAAVFVKFQGFYKEAKRQVDTELAKISTVEADFEAVLNKADERFKAWVHQDLEYIYTPGFFDYSDWKDINKKEIDETYQELRKEQGSENRFIGWYDPIRIAAMDIVRDRHAKRLFDSAKSLFISDVMHGLETIAAKVVETLNNAKKHILEAEEETKKIYEGLDKDQQAEMTPAFQAVMGQYETLEGTVKDREREIIDDMARTYSRSVGKLQGTFDTIKKDVLTSWLEKAWNKLKAIVNAIIEFAARIVELLGRMASLVGDIISSPRAFFRNLITGIGEGFSEFGSRIDEFLATAFFDWIRGTSGVQVQLPKEWNAAGIFSLFTQLLNLSTETVWQRMEVIYDSSVANAFRKGEVVLEKGLEIFDIVRREGLGGLWDHIVESLGTLLSDTLDEMKETILYAAIKKVFIEIGKMLIPGGGFIVIAEKLIRLVVFIVEARNKILDLIESFVASMENAVRGDISGIVKRVTSALTKFITVALDFLVSFFGLSGLKEKVERVIERMRSPVVRGIDFVLKKLKPLVMKGKELVLKGKQKVVVVGERIVRAVRRWLGLEKKFVANDGMEHKLYFAGSETNPILTISTHPTAFATFMQSVEVGSDAKKQAAKDAALIIARLIDKKRLEPLEGTTKEEKDQSRAEKLLAVDKLLDDLAVPTKALFGELTGVAEPEIHNTKQGGGYGLMMEALRLNKKQKAKGSGPTSTMIPSFVILNRRRQEGNPETAYYMKGHLLNEEVGGKGDWMNLTPLSRKGNSDHEGKVEALVKAAFQSGAVVGYNVKAEYGYGQNETRIPADDPKASEKKEVIKQEENVPKALSCEAFVMDKHEDGSLGRKQDIVKLDVPNPIGQDASSYVFSDTPPRPIVFLNDADEGAVAAIEGIDDTMAQKIVLAHKKNKEIYDRSRFNSYEELSDARKNWAYHRVFPTAAEQAQVLKLGKLPYVKLYKGAKGVPAATTEPEPPTS